MILSVLVNGANSILLSPSFFLSISFLCSSCRRRRRRVHLRWQAKHNKKQQQKNKNYDIRPHRQLVGQSMHCSQLIDRSINQSTKFTNVNWLARRSRGHCHIFSIVSVCHSHFIRRERVHRHIAHMHTHTHKCGMIGSNFFYYSYTYCIFNGIIRTCLRVYLCTNARVFVQLIISSRFIIAAGDFFYRQRLRHRSRTRMRTPRQRIGHTWDV